MVQTGVFDRVPIYSDATLEPYSVVYVPVGRAIMRAYERRRDGELAGTSGSRTPTFPVAPVATFEPPPERTAATAGTAVGSTLWLPAAPEPVASRPTHARIESVPRPHATDGIWIQFNGAKWYSNGEAVAYSPTRFM
jgi:hypothetical protein